MLPNGVKLNTPKPNLEMGDHIYVIVHEPIAYEHHGIFIGDNKVLHFNNQIIQSSLESFADNKIVKLAPNKYTYSALEKYNYFDFMTTNITKRYSRKDIKKRALSRIGTGKYKLDLYNGEHFASWCVCGAYCS